MKNKIPLYHNVGYNACRKVGCYYIGGEFTKATIIRACDFELLDGNSPEPNSILICGSCGSYMEINIDCRCKYNE